MKPACHLDKSNLNLHHTLLSYTTYSFPIDLVVTTRTITMDFVKNAASSIGGDKNDKKDSSSKGSGDKDYVDKGELPQLSAVH